GPAASRARRPSSSVTSWTSPRSRSSGKMSLGIVGSSGFTDHADAHLAGVGRLGLDAAGKIARQEDRLLVCDRAVLDDDADLAPHLQRVGLLDAVHAFGELLEVVQTLDVALQRLAARARALARQAIRRVDDVVE